MDRSALARATDSSDAPTPGYLFLDIGKSCATGPKACHDTIQYLLKRLQNKNHNIKYKTLKVIAKVAENPATRGQFKREVATNPQLVGLIRDSSTFRGPPDPLRGMAIYERVHEAAKEALSAIYSDSGSGPSDGMAPGVGTSYGAPVSGGYGGASSYSGGGGMGTGAKMEGIGNPMFADPRLVPQNSQRGIAGMTVTEVMSTVGETVVNMVKDPLARNVQIPPARGFSNSYNGPPGRNELSAATGGAWTMASNRGPNAIQAPGMGYNPDKDAYMREKDTSSFGWAQNPSTNSTPVRGGIGGSWGSAGGGVAAAARETPSNHIRPQTYSTPASFGGSGGTAVSDGSYERGLIAELCPPGGMKAEPPADKLEQFVRSAPSLNADLVCPVLLDNLEDGTPWIVKAKALCVIEHTIRATGHLEPNPYADFFHACAEEIQPLCSHARAAIREPAKRVMKELGLEYGDTTPVEAAFQEELPTPMPAQPAYEADLLDFGGAPMPVAPAPAAAPPAPESIPTNPVSVNGGSLFGGLTVQQPTAAKSAVDAFIQEPNLLGGFSPANSEVEPVTASVSTETADLFGNMSIKENIPASSAVAGSAPSGGSAFSFIKESAVAPAPSATEHPTPPKPESFDPLLSLDWSGQQSSANKMQAIAAEHQKIMMLQQQQQQLHLRQAMMQQQVPGMIGMNPTPIGAVNGTYMTVTSPSKGNVMRAHNMKQIPILGQNPQQSNPAMAFSFLRDDVAEKKKQQEHSFDFIKDAMKTKK